ncbi:endo-N-acetyl-beta-D-glucosaminidase precursor [Pochonia chlamydosporia 170]|uniref:Endo-N-acetyl-beta-D-glucosaminidase n=1 Tax=Pochonia chlamydosporia 170 TaxID=1380566 RepID=A0A179EZV0_METCM|nr:endo-N-acetyl-beta-D-glucosaminidase precursor [Pochonia chlamydosporia 170]OAQ58373.1 endo-N-acetyl-beta-D-glucosaminidase precursor [Pochonia chlamydosporia 170]
MLFKLSCLVAALATVSLASPITEVVRAIPELPRLIIYFQTTHSANGKPISMLPLVNQKGIALTHLIVCSLHVNEGGQIHLNDYPPSNALFYTLWNETQIMKNAGIKVMGMVGGAAPGSFSTGTLDGNPATFEKYYGQLRDVIRQYKLQGLDIDVEQPMSQAGIQRLVARLHTDFGPDFIISLAPVASALSGGPNLSGFDYKVLDSGEGSKINFYNGQFYSGFGSMSNPSLYNRIVAGGFKASRVVAGQLTSPDNGSGYIPDSQLNATVISLRNQHGQIGGVMGWEYFNSVPGKTSEPWKWAQIMTQILRPNSVPKLRISKSTAEQLATAFDQSTKAHPLSNSRIQDSENVDYHAMINI